MRFDFDGRVFRAVQNSSNGEVSGETVFHYHQQEDIVWAAYGGGDIRLGSLLAKMDDDGSLEARYQHINEHGEFRTGECKTRVEALPDGRYRLHEKWQWTSGDRSSGESVVEEVRQHP